MTPDDAEDAAEEAATRDAISKQNAAEWAAKGKKADEEDAAETRWLSGCTPTMVVVLLIFVALGAAGAIKLASGNDNNDKAAASTSSCSSLKARRDDLRLVVCVKPDDTGSSSDQNSATDASGSTASGAVLGSNPGNIGSGGSAPPPDAASLPPGAILFKGTSGDQIGCIACDGASRFLSITGPGVAVGDAAGTGIAFTWEKNGKVTSFGANLNTWSNKGRYGINVFRNVPAVPPTTSPSGEGDGGQYRAGCAIEVGNTACRSDRAGAPLAIGDKVTIIIGEAGTGTGTYTCDWWFVFQPDT